MLQIFSQTPPFRDVYIITKSPPERNSNSKSKMDEMTEEIQPLNEGIYGIIVSDDTLGSSKSRFMNQLFMRDRHKN